MVRQHHPLAARGRGDREQLHRLRKHGAGTARTWATARVGGELPARADAGAGALARLRSNHSQQSRHGARPRRQGERGAAAFRRSRTSQSGLRGRPDQPGELLWRPRARPPTPSRTSRRRSPSSPITSNRASALAQCCCARGKPADADPQYREALRLDPRLAEAAQRPRRRAGDGRAETTRRWRNTRKPCASSPFRART